MSYIGYNYGVRTSFFPNSLKLKRCRSPSTERKHGVLILQTTVMLLEGKSVRKSGPVRHSSQSDLIYKIYKLFKLNQIILINIYLKLSFYFNIILMQPAGFEGVMQTSFLCEILSMIRSMYSPIER